MLYSSCYSVQSTQDAAFLSMWVTLLYVCLEAPRDIYSHSSLNNFVTRAALKFLVMFVMLLAIINV